MWQRVAIVVGLGFVAGFAVAMLVTGGTLLKAKLADNQSNRTLQLPASEETTPETAPETSSGSSKETAKTKAETKTAPPAAAPPVADSDLGCGLSEVEKYNIETWIKKTNRNIYGDPADTVYAGGTPLFNEFTGKYTERCQYILDNHTTKPWNS